MGSVKSVLKQANKEANKSIVTLGVEIEDPPRLPTGIFQLDLAIGGGFPEGRISLLYGMESSMKTTIALLLIASAQRKYPDRTAVFIDVEHLFTKGWAKQLGVDVEKLAYVSPESAEQVVDVAEAMLMAEDVSIVVIDSLAAMVTQHELEKSAEDAIVGRTGLVINKLYRKCSNALGLAKMHGFTPTLVVLNQIRYKIGVMHGNPETMPGGPAFLFASSLTLRLHGKDVMDKSISKTLAAFKEVSATVKKFKIPIVQKSCVFQLAVLPHPGLNLQVGETFAANTIMAYLKMLNLFDNLGKSGWELIHPGTGEVEKFKLQDDFKEKLITDKAWAIGLKNALIPRVMETGELILTAEEQKAAEKGGD